MPDKTLKPDFYKKLAIIVVVIGILLRFGLAAVHTVAGDACWQLSASRFLAENKKFPLFESLGRQEPFWAPPLFHIMEAFLYTMFGFYGINAAEFGMKMLSPLLGSLTLILTYLINRRFFDEKITFYSMTFTTFIPMFIDYHVFSYVDGTVTFFIVSSIYFALNGKYIKSSIAAGLATLTKYNGIFVLPLLIYITYKNTKEKKLLAVKVAIFLIVPLLIASPWFIRNYNHFENPFWPFVNFIFHGMETSAFESANLQAFKPENIIHVNSIIFTYLAVFGVPDGNYRNIFFFDIPYIKIFLATWILGTLIFIFPLTKGFGIKNKTKKRILAIWILSYAAVVLLYVGNAGWTAARFLMPAIPAIGMFYGIGLNKMDFKNKKIKMFLYFMLFAVVAGLAATEFVKINLASKEWVKYKSDFLWIRENTGKGDLILPGDQCLAYHTNRGTLKGTAENLKYADYIFVNQKFNLERRSILSDEILNEVKEDGYKKVYENKKTGTYVYGKK